MAFFSLNSLLDLSSFIYMYICAPRFFFLEELQATNLKESENKYMQKMQEKVEPRQSLSI